MILPTSNSTVIPVFKSSFESSSCNDLRMCRTIWNIIWSCIFTLFACVWLSVHPNIPAPDDSWGRVAIRRLWTMIVVLLAPELLVGWASRQWILASKVAKENEEYEWTRAHGFFAIMGGFMECDKDGRPIRTVTIDKIDTIPEKTKRRILEEDVEVRSKGDILSKSFAILQTTWFILQCISRSIEGLPVTELEIATVAFCVLNFATYILWWNKPLNVGHSIRLYADEGKVDEVEEDKAEKDKAGKDKVGKDGCIRKRWKAFKQGLVDIPKEIYRPIAGICAAGEVMETLFLFPVFLGKSILAGDSYEDNPRRVGTFGPQYKTTHLDELMSAGVGTVFGAIHCTAWTSHFASRTERVLWRAAAISVTSVPPLMTISMWIHRQRIQVFGINFLTKCFNIFMYSIAFTGLSLYILARLTLLVLPFMSLRALLPGAFATVNWTRFIPHI